MQVSEAGTVSAKPVPLRPEPDQQKTDEALDKRELEGSVSLSAQRQQVEEYAVPENLLWRYEPCRGSVIENHPMRTSPAIGLDGRAFVAIGSNVVMFVDGKSEPQWTYVTGGPIYGSPALGPDGNVRVHSSDGHVHIVAADGKRICSPVDVGPPLAWAMPMIDSKNRTWIALSAGGLTWIDADGLLAHRPYFRTSRRFDCVGVIRDEVLYIGCEDHFVQAISLNGKRGESIWDAARDAGRTAGAIHCPLVISGNDELIVISQDGLLHAFHWDGSSKWSVPIPGQVLGSPVVDPAGTIIVGVSLTPRHQPATGLILAIDGATRKTRWKFEVDSPIESTPVIGDDGVIYFGDNGGNLYALSAACQLLWKSTFNAQIRSAGALLGSGILAFGIDDGSLVAMKCSSEKLADKGWPKLQRSAAQSGLIDA